MEGVTQFSIGPGSAAPYRIAAVTPEKKSQPARVRVYNGSQGPVAVKSFFKAQDIVLRWSPNGRSLLIETHTDVDSTKSSYYGETNLYLLRTDGSFDCTVQRTAEGPLHDVAWSPVGREFAIIAGRMPANVTLYDPNSGDAIHELGAAHRNTLCYSPHGRFLCVAGFGNLRGDMDFFDIFKRKLMGSVRANCAIDYGWSPDSRSFFTASTRPRMQVDNNINIYSYAGEGPLFSKDFECLYKVCWRPALKGTYPDRPQSPRLEAKLKSSSSSSARSAQGGAKSAKRQAYRPPGARNRSSGRTSSGGRSLSAMLGEGGAGPGKIDKKGVSAGEAAAKAAKKRAVKERKKRAKAAAKAKAEAEAQEAARKAEEEERKKREIEAAAVAKAKSELENPSLMSKEKLAKRIKATKKKIRKVEELKVKADAGEKLNDDQTAKLTTLDSLRETLARLELHA